MRRISHSSAAVILAAVVFSSPGGAQSTFCSQLTTLLNIDNLRTLATSQLVPTPADPDRTKWADAKAVLSGFDSNCKIWEEIAQTTYGCDFNRPSRGTSPRVAVNALAVQFRPCLSGWRETADSNPVTAEVAFEKGNERILLINLAGDLSVSIVRKKEPR